MYNKGIVQTEDSPTTSPIATMSTNHVIKLYHHFNTPETILTNDMISEKGGKTDIVVRTITNKANNPCYQFI
jgi:hypothetical protein